MPVVAITAATLDDAPAIARLLAEMDDFYGVPRTDPSDQRVRQISEALFTDPPAAYALLARDGGRPPARGGVPLLADLPALLDIAARVEQDTADYSELKRLLRAGSSLGGARPKAHVLDEAGNLAIAKFPSASSDTWNVMAWEKVALDLARSSGVAVPDSQLIRIGDRHALIVDRRRDRGTAPALAADGLFRPHLQHGRPSPKSRVSAPAWRLMGAGPRL